MPDSSSILFGSYVLIGPAAWALYALMLWMGVRRMARRRDQAKPSESPPGVTILIPAKDEGPDVAIALRAALALDYPNFTIVAINDRSSDDTGKVMDEIAAQDPRLRVLHIQPGTLPEGWLGKCHALHAGAKLAQGEWILFVDADVTLQPQALRSTLSLAAGRNYDALSLLTRLECRTFWERLVLPLAAGAWSSMHLVSLTNDDNRPDHAYANGQFILVRRDVYEMVRGHEAVRDCITEDVELMRLIKSHGRRTRLLLGQHLAATRMHAKLRQMFHGWARIYSGSSRRRPWRILASALFVLLSLAAYPLLARAIVAEQTRWIWATAIHVGMITVVVAAVYRMSGNRGRYAVLFPLAGGMLLAIFAFALRACATGRIAWRGTQYSQRKLPACGLADQGSDVR